MMYIIIMISCTYFDKNPWRLWETVGDPGDCFNRYRDITDVVCDDFMGVRKSLGTKKVLLRLAALHDGSPSPPGAWKRPLSIEMTLCPSHRTIRTRALSSRNCIFIDFSIFRIAEMPILIWKLRT